MSDLPPYAELLRLRSEAGADGAPLFVMPWHDDVMGRPLFLHGGAIAGLLEFAAFGTLRQAIGDDAVVAKPVTVTVNYMLGGRDRETCAAAVVERLGRTIANVEAFAWQDSRDKPIASARINFLLER
jgi:uncharacterized protein (TIGR00369 family)